MRKSFILHMDSLTVVEELTIEQKAELFQAIIDYQNGKEIVLSGLMKAIFIPFKNQFERDNDKYSAIVERNKANGAKGGRGKNPKKPKETQKNPVGFLETQSNPNKADNDNDNDNDNVINIYQYKDFVLDFQTIVGKKMNGNEKTKSSFAARLKEGFTKEQFCRAMENCKNDKWHIENPQYLTIEFILRNDKLEKYLNIVPEQKKSSGLTLEQAQARMRGEMI
jgi:uncharacterized phage protein (TIGR02220 family)